MPAPWWLLLSCAELISSAVASSPSVSLLYMAASPRLARAPCARSCRAPFLLDAVQAARPGSSSPLRAPLIHGGCRRAPLRAGRLSLPQSVSKLQPRPCPCSYGGAGRISAARPWRPVEVAPTRAPAPVLARVCISRSPGSPEDVFPIAPCPRPWNSVFSSVVAGY